MIKDFLKKQKKAYLTAQRRKQIGDLGKYFTKDCTIISNNCLAGFIYQDLDMPYTTPTIGMYFFFPDYIEFLSNLQNNLTADIEFVDQSKYDLGNKRLKSSKHKYPVGLLNGKSEIHFLHYESEAEVRDKWKRRLERVNWDNLVILGTQLDGCTADDVKNFDKLPFQRKLFITREDYQTESGIYIEKFRTNDNVGNPYEYGDVLYKNLNKKISGLNF